MLRNRILVKSELVDYHYLFRPHWTMSSVNNIESRKKCYNNDGCYWCVYRGQYHQSNEEIPWFVQAYSRRLIMNNFRKATKEAQLSCQIISMMNLKYEPFYELYRTSPAPKKKETKSWNILPNTSYLFPLSQICFYVLFWKSLPSLHDNLKSRN